MTLNKKEIEEACVEYAKKRLSEKGINLDDMKFTCYLSSEKQYDCLDRCIGSTIKAELNFHL